VEFAYVGERAILLNPARSLLSECAAICSIVACWCSSRLEVADCAVGGVREVLYFVLGVGMSVLRYHKGQSAGAFATWTSYEKGE